MALSFKDRLRASKIVPVIRHDDCEIARQSCDLLVEQGLTALEVTTTIPGFAKLIKELRQEFPGIEIGAGTVLTQQQASLAIDAGAHFLVSPCWSDPVSKASEEAEIPYLPGAMTPDEVFHHADAGAAIVKVFPAGLFGGPSYLKALASVFPEIPLMPTGGVTPQNTPASK